MQKRQTTYQCIRNVNLEKNVAYTVDDMTDWNNEKRDTDDVGQKLLGRNHQVDLVHMVNSDQDAEETKLGWVSFRDHEPLQVPRTLYSLLSPLKSSFNKNDEKKKNSISVGKSECHYGIHVGMYQKQK